MATGVVGVVLECVLVHVVVDNNLDLVLVTTQDPRMVEESVWVLTEGKEHATLMSNAQVRLYLCTICLEQLSR